MRWNVWIAFASLCLLSGTSWAIPNDTFDVLPPLERQGLLFCLIGVIALLFAGRDMWSRSKKLPWARVAGAAVGFFGIPVVVAEYAQGVLSVTSRSALFVMVPIVVVMVLAAGEAATRDELGVRRFLLPALAGLGGLLLLLPLQFSGSVRGRVMLGVVCAAVVLVGLASVWLYRLLGKFSAAEASAVVGLANGVFLLGWSTAHEDLVWRGSGFGSLPSIGSLVDVAEVLLIVWLLQKMPPVRFAARYLLIPLLTVLESFVLVRPEWTVRIGFGTVLLAVGAELLLFMKTGEEETTLSLQ